MEQKIPLFVYVKFFGLWLTSTIISVIGMYAHLKYPNQTLVQALSIALPFAWMGLKSEFRRMERTTRWMHDDDISIVASRSWV